MKVYIAVPVWGEFHGGTRDIRYRVVLLEINTLVAISAEGAGPVYGQWTSTSHFIGKKVTSSYYVRNVRVSTEERWSVDPGAPFPITNPVAFFFDATSDPPFMILQGFEPLKMISKAGSGYLRQTAPEVVGSVIYWGLGTHGMPVDADWLVPKP